jgi:hypothetical protein
LAHSAQIMGILQKTRLEFQDEAISNDSVLRFANCRFWHEDVTEAFPHNVNELDLAYMNKVSGEWVDLRMKIHLQVGSDIVQAIRSISRQCLESGSLATASLTVLSDRDFAESGLQTLKLRLDFH